MRDIVDKLKDRLLPGDTKERCGFISKRGRIVELVNTHETPEVAFKVPAKDVLDAIEKGHVATWHTHPKSDPNLSGEDYECFCAWDDMVHYIVGRRDKQVVVTKYAVEDGILVQK